MQVDDCQSPRLHAHDLGIEVIDVPQVLVDESGHLGRLPASRLTGDQHELILDDGVQDLFLLLVDGQLEDHLRASACELDLWALVVDVPSDLFRSVEDVVILLCTLSRPIPALPSVPRPGSRPRLAVPSLLEGRFPLPCILHLDYVASSNPYLPIAPQKGLLLLELFLVHPAELLLMVAALGIRANLHKSIIIYQYQPIDYLKKIGNFISVFQELEQVGKK